MSKRIKKQNTVPSTCHNALTVGIVSKDFKKMARATKKENQLWNLHKEGFSDYINKQA